MKLEDVTAEIRPRVPWESIDLGCALARAYITIHWKAWAFTVIPLWIALAILLRNHPFWFIICTWWLKPIYDRVSLMITSRALFGAAPTAMEVVKAFPKMLVGGLFHALVIRRFSPSRSLTMPVSELEGLKGKKYRQRVDLLGRNGGEGASLATVVGFVLQLTAMTGVILFVMAMMPSEVSNQWSASFEEFLSTDDTSNISLGFLWSLAIAWLVSIFLMEPFYASAGFALYINSRTLTEGWDIELAFKRMSTRIQSLKKTGLLLLLSVSSMVAFSPQTLEAQTEAEQVQEIMASEDFRVHSKIVEVPVEKESNSNLPAINGVLLGIFGNVLFVIVLILVVLGLAYLIYINRHLFGFLPGTKVSAEMKFKTQEIMGMDISPESLPDDVIHAATEAFQQGNSKLALSLLYRSSLVWLVEKVDLPIEEGDTEGDCLHRVGQIPNAPYQSYFNGLTQSWIGVAYGEQRIQDGEFNSLIEQWPFSGSAQPERRGV